MWCAADIYNYMCHICAKGVDLNFNQAVIDKMSNFQEMRQILHILKIAIF